MNVENGLIFTNTRNKKHFKDLIIVSIVLLFFSFLLFIFTLNLITIITGIIFSFFLFIADWLFLDKLNPYQIGITDFGLDLYYHNRKIKNVKWNEIKKIDKFDHPDKKDGKARIFYYKRTRITEKGYIIAIYNIDLLNEIVLRCNQSSGGVTIY